MRNLTSYKCERGVHNIADCYMREEVRKNKLGFETRRMQYKQGGEKMLRKIGCLTSAVMLAVVFTACGSSTSQKEESVETVQTSTESTASAQTQNSAGGKASGETKRITLGTASIGGNLYVSGCGLAQVISEKLDGIEMSAEVSGGSGPNVGLVNNKEMDFALTTDVSGYNGYHGTGWAQGNDFSEIRSMFSVNPAALEIVAKENKGITSVRDLEGKIVTAGTASGGGSITAMELFNTLNIKPKQKMDLGWSDAMTAVGDDLINVALDFGGFPNPSRQEFCSTNEAQWIMLDDADRKKMCETYPYYYEGTIPAGTYKYFPADGYKTIMSDYEMICHKDADEELVYEIVKAVFDNTDELLLSTSSFSYTKPEAVNNLSVPLHPGAIRYFEEIGIKLKDELYPPEYVKK